MSDETGKWKAYNGDGSAHTCNSKTTSSTNGASEVDQKAVIKTVLARLDGIRQDLERLTAG